MSEKRNHNSDGFTEEHIETVHVPQLPPVPPMRLEQAALSQGRERLTGESGLEEAVNHRSIGLHEAPDFTPGHIDIAQYVKAQATFLETQTWFLEQKSGPMEEYVHAVTVYSKAQRDFIKAQADVLRQLGVI